jgi:hypothetical protein
MRILIMIAAAVVAAATLVITGPTASAQETLVAPKNPLTVRVANANGQCAAVPAASTVPGERVIQWPCGNWRDHYWTMDINRDTFQIITANSGQCMAIPGGSTRPGERVIQWPCGNHRDHFWFLVFTGGGRFQILNVGSGQCLAVPGASTVPGEGLIQWPCGNYPDHFWHFPDLDALAPGHGAAHPG